MPGGQGTVGDRPSSSFCWPRVSINVPGRCVGEVGGATLPVGARRLVRSESAPFQPRWGVG